MIHVVGLCGSLRRGSSNRALLLALSRALPPGARFTLYDRLGELPHFDPDLDAEGSRAPAPVADLRALMASAQAVVISSPEYAHGIPGSLKNALDWLVSCGELAGKPVALLNAGGGEIAQRALVEVLTTMSWAVDVEASRLTPFLKRKLAADEAVEPEVEAELRRIGAALLRSR